MPQNQTNFQRQIGLFSGICFVIGTIIGSGIFISPKGVFSNANCSYTNAIIVWSICGLYSMLGSLCYAELGTTIVRSGGDYAYIKSGFGSLISFLFLWLNVVVIRPASQAILSLTFAYYLLGAFVDRDGCQQYFINYELSSRIIAALSISLLSIINCINVKWAINLQNIFTLLKLIALLSIIVSGIGAYFFGDLFQQNQNDNSEPTINISESIRDQCESRLSLSIYSGLFAFGGWNYLNIVTDELKNPYKNLPRAALVGIFVSTIVYVLANVAYFLILTPNEILTSPAIALTFARKINGPFGVILISLSIASSALGSLNATVFTTSRLFCIGAQEKHLPSVMGMLHHQRCTPIVSLVISVLVTFFMLFAPDIYSLINYFSFTYWLWTGISVSSGVYLRYKSPDLNRPIKLSLPILYLFILLCLLLTGLAIVNDPLNSFIGVVLVLAGMPVYYLFVAHDKSPHQLDYINRFIQKLFLIVDTDSSNDTIK